MRILLAVDGSDHALRATRHCIASHDWYRETPEIHLITVQTPIASGAVTMFFSHEQLNSYYQEQAQQALRPAQSALNGAGVSYVEHIGVGEISDTVVAFANKLGCRLLVMGTRGMGSIPNMLLGSVATKVLHLATIPVVLVK